MSEITDAMVDAYLGAQRRTVEAADQFGRPNIGGLHANTVREATRNGISAALAAGSAQPDARVQELERENAALQHEFDKLKTPEGVRLAMLRGAIAKPSLRECAHAHGADALQALDKALAAVSAQPDTHLRELAAYRLTVENLEREIKPLRLYENLANEFGLEVFESLAELQKDNVVLRMRLQSAMELIATPARPDGTWNRDRQACCKLAQAALSGSGPSSEMPDLTQLTARGAGSTHIIRYALEMGLLWIDGDGRDKVREALDALDALEAQLASIGAGGVTGPLIGQPQAMPDLTELTERGAKAWSGVNAQDLREGDT